MTGADIRERLGHPVIDADGHQIEFLPLVRDLLVEEGGHALGDRLDALVASPATTRQLDVDTKRTAGIARTGWWGLPTSNTLDRATVTLPRLLHRRLDELGIDVAVLYPTFGLTVMAVDDEETRLGIARACNRYYAEVFADVSDRVLPVAVIPTYTPAEALAELDHAVGELGLRAVLMGGLVLRYAPGHEGDRASRWVDGLGLDSPYDYTPVWQRCAELGVAPTFHSTGIGFGSRVSPTNYVANHIGNFAAGVEAVCRSLFFAGVYRSFPGLRFSFLEGGTAWAAQLLADIVGHWQKRNGDAIRHYDPGALDRDLLERLVAEHGPASFLARLGRLEENLTFLCDPDEPAATIDEFALSRIGSIEDIVGVFDRQLFFGCEADDPMNGLAFDRRLHPGGIALRAMFASDIGHWDVPDFRGVLVEAWELVENGRMDAEDFRSFAFGNAAALWGERVFAGTVVEGDVKAEVSAPG